MSTRVYFTANAVSDVHAIIDAISVDDEKRGELFVRELSLRTAAKLAAFPQADPTIGEFRYAFLDRYVLLYKYDSWMDAVTVFMIVENHRNWRKQFDVTT